MNDQVDFIGRLVWVTLIGLVIAHQVWSRAARRRQDADLCIRCGKVPADVMSPDQTGRATMCAECLRITRRNYRSGSWFFYSLAVLFGFMAPFVIVSEYKLFGIRTALADAGLFIFVIGLTAGAGFFIRYFGRKIT